ncbi:MAG: branched-chain amino acid ABC transporter permease [Treponemataceae bacterium]|nr:MAG: branched-chain amino acid ABC transporter permease [Treponemataceae bacterium]
MNIQQPDVFFRIESFFSQKRYYFLAALTIILLILPVFDFNRYIMRICIVIGIYSMLALALNMVAGYTGQLSMGNAGFYAIGAYTATLLMKGFGINFWFSMLIAAAFAGISGLLLGLPTLRLKGSYLTIVTLGFGEIIRMILMNWDPVTNGPLGIRNIPLPSIFGIPLSIANHGLYYLDLALLALISLFCAAVINSKIGRAFIAIREDEIAAQMMGIRTVRYKVLAFVLSAAISGIAGAFYAPMVGYIDPNSFTFDVSSQIISMAIFGGLGTMRGMYFGAAALIIFPEAARFLMDYRFVLYGIILVLMMRFRPQGLLGWRSRLSYRFDKDVGKELAAEGILPPELN